MEDGIASFTHTYTHILVCRPGLCWSVLARILCLVKYQIKSPQRKSKNIKYEQRGRKEAMFSLSYWESDHHWIIHDFAHTWVTIYFNSIWRKKHVWSSVIFSPDMAGRSGVISSGYIFAAEWKIRKPLSPKLNFKQGFEKWPLSKYMYLTLQHSRN